MAASDWAHWDADRGEYGYYLENGTWIVANWYLEQHE